MPRIRIFAPSSSWLLPMVSPVDDVQSEFFHGNLTPNRHDSAPMPDCSEVGQ
jgi:hypothetical protein